MTDLEQLPLISQIPDEQAVRLRLAQLVREQTLLRTMLRLARQKQDAQERDRLQREEVSRAS